MERWPAVYDAEDLDRAINAARDHTNLSSFFDARPTRARRCQGDIVSVPSDIPLIDHDGEPAMSTHDGGLWLVIGNSCDFERDINELKWTQIVPLVHLGTEQDVDPGLLSDIQAYRTSRHFYVPDWSATQPPRQFLAEFPMPVTVHKEAILSSQVEARLSRAAWILLHGCLVRFLARDDGRFAA